MFARGAGASVVVGISSRPSSSFVTPICTVPSPVWRSALTGMHTYADSLFFVNRPDVPTDDLDIVDLAPTILTLLGVEPPADMDGRVRLRA